MTKKILIEGMSCGHCVRHVKEALSELTGVSKVDVDLNSKSAVIETTADVSDADIKFAVEDAGYDVVSISPTE